MQYLEFKINCSEELAEVLMAELSHIGFDSFWQEEDHIKAYIDSEVYNLEELSSILEYYGIDAKTILSKELENRNWNELWEKSYPALIVADKCYVRASFHPPKPQYPYEIVIQPKMSFGTGHHATTSQIMELMLLTDFRGVDVLDMGCGTGLLAVLAHKLGAEKITAVDNDEWAYKNTLENLHANKVLMAEVIFGDIDDVKDEKFNVILSNITKNVNLQFLPYYAQMLSKNGKLIASGFYTEDLEDIKTEAIKHGFSLLSNRSKNNWCAAIFVYNNGN